MPSLSSGESLQDPVGIHLVTSLARLGANLTALSSTAPGQHGKSVELLREIVPGLAGVVVSTESNDPSRVAAWDEIRTTENSHQPTRQRERAMRRLKWPEQALRSLGPFGAVGDHFRVGRPRNPAAARRQLLAAQRGTSRDVVGLPAGGLIETVTRACRLSHCWQTPTTLINLTVPPWRRITS